MRERVPTTRGDITVPTEHTTAIGKCAHCGELLRLAYNGDALQTSVSHASPSCAAWRLGGALYAARAGSVDPERAVELMVDQRRLLLAVTDVTKLVHALDLYRVKLEDDIATAKRDGAELPAMEEVRAEVRELASMLATVGREGPRS